MWLAKELEHWREFFFLLGTAGSTLVALLFVAVSLGAGYLNEQRTLATRTFFSTPWFSLTVLWSTGTPG